MQPQLDVKLLWIAEDVQASNQRTVSCMSGHSEKATEYFNADKILISSAGPQLRKERVKAGDTCSCPCISR